MYIDHNRVQNLLVQFKDLFHGIGRLTGGYHITTRKELPRIAHTLRHFPRSLITKLKAELDRMVEAKVIIPVKQPTLVCSSMIVVEKPQTGELSICLDTPELNQYILRENCQIPSKEERQAEIKDAKLFSKIDASAAFWHLKLDEVSSSLCTFNTPFGRFKYLVMPYGIKSASEIFQRELMKGVINIHDDIIIWSSNIEEHFTSLEEVFNVCRQKWLKLNRNKVKIGVREVKFFGELLTNDGIKPDPDKISAIKDMLHPVDKSGLSRFLGFINFLSKFIPNVSKNTCELRQCLKGEQFQWGIEQSKEFKYLKEILTSEPLLQYYCPDLPTKVQVDSSEDGLGAVLLQEHNGLFLPVAYGARATSVAERNYAPIERETLAICFGCKYFHQYIYGLTTVIVESDHTPLSALFNKTLKDNPPRIQRFRMQAMKYSITIAYVPGQDMWFSDTLSRSRYGEEHKSKPNESLSRDVEIHVNMIRENLPVSELKWKEIVDKTIDDETLSEVKHYICNSWPECIAECSAGARDYFNYRDELSVLEGVLIKGNRVVISTIMRHNILERLHVSHLGIEKIR